MRKYGMVNASVNVYRRRYWKMSVLQPVKSLQRGFFADSWGCYSLCVERAIHGSLTDWRQHCTAAAHGVDHAVQLLSHWPFRFTEHVTSNRLHRPRSKTWSERSVRFAPTASKSEWSLNTCHVTFYAGFVTLWLATPTLYDRCFQIAIRAFYTKLSYVYNRSHRSDQALQHPH